MTTINRRQFLAWGASFAALMGLDATAIPKVAEALENLAAGEVPVLWLQGLSCSGCSVSLLNSEAPGPAEILTAYISLAFHSTLSAATGEVAVETINGMIEHGGYYLAVEGSMPAGMPTACMLGEEPVTNQVLRAARNAKAVLSVGACASFGGIPAAEGNPTGAVSVQTFLQDQHVAVPLINLPGCPAHPDWIVGTLVHVLKFGMPVLDERNRPVMFYGKIIHDQCPRFADYEREKFAKKFSDEGCLFKLGCLGPVTHADCTLRLWNGRTNYCIKAGAPCIGCASHDFASRKSFPFYTPRDEA
jgi:hydrogenase small subunit